MKSLFVLAGTLAVGVVPLLGSATAAPAGTRPGTAFTVTITNLTRGQVFSPPLLATHTSDASLFTPGQPASPELAALAENGDSAPLATLLDGDAAVFEVVPALDPILPGESATYRVTSAAPFRALSAAGMLISTNDAFFALDGVRLPRGSQVLDVLVPAYDAGSEANSEDCAFVPGPPCGAGAVHDPAPAEGYVYVSNGIQGIGGVPRDESDWNNPVARIVVTRE